MTAPNRFGRIAGFALLVAFTASLAPQDALARRAKRAPLPPARPALKSEMVPLPPARPVLPGEAAPLPQLRPEIRSGGMSLASLPPQPKRPAARKQDAGETAERTVISSAFATVQSDPLAGVTLADLPRAGQTVSAALEAGEVGGESVPIPPTRPAASGADTPTGKAVPMPQARPAVAPPPSILVSKSDYALLKSAFAALDKRDFPGALALKNRMADGTAKDLIEWRYVHSAPVTIGYDRMATFADSHAFWPQHAKLAARMEEALFLERQKTKRILRVFADTPPYTGAGMAALAFALDKSGDTEGATKWVSEAWRSQWLNEHQEQKILERFGKLLSNADHKTRFDMLLYRQSFAAAKRLTKQIGAKYSNLITVRAALDRKQKNAGVLLDRLPQSLKGDPVAIYSRVQWLRRKGQAAAAAELMLKAPHKRAIIVDAAAWWQERQALAREMIDTDRFDKAYALASNHALKRGADFAEAEFLAGWIALRHLRKPEVAERHFQTLRRGVVRPISISRAEYWLGRSWEARGGQEKARLHYANAATHSVYFYGQLARLKLGGDVLYYPALPQPDESVLSRFESNDLVRAATLLNEMGEAGLARLFMTELARLQHDPQELHLTATMAQQFGMRDIGYRVGKIASIKGIPLVEFAYMTDGLPEFERRGRPVEDALLHALVRQESAFNTQAISHAGAQGLMQLMPPTAKAVAKQHGAPYSKSRLLSDPAYNAMLGTAHLGDLLSAWRGSYIMAVAAYNAGEHRLKQWIARYGDPRDPSVDPIDWIESIPFNETRDYVQRVLENLQVYRARLNDNLAALRISTDLRRGSSK